MATQLNPYLNFRDQARAAMEFYSSVFGGELSMQTFKEAGASPNAGDDEKIMHAQLITPNGITLMASDTPARMEYTAGGNVQLSLTGENEPELRGYFDRLAEGGAVTMPLEQAPWGDTFGMCADRFGIRWMVNISAQR